MIRVSIASMRANLCSISLNRSAASSSRPPPPPPPPLPDPSDPSLSLCGRVGVTCVSHGADPPSPAASSSSRILRRRSASSRRAMVLTDPLAGGTAVVPRDAPARQPPPRASRGRGLRSVASVGSRNGSGNVCQRQPLERLARIRVAEHHPQRRLLSNLLDRLGVGFLAPLLLELVRLALAVLLRSCCR